MMITQKNKFTIDFVFGIMAGAIGCSSPVKSKVVIHMISGPSHVAVGIRRCSATMCGNV